MTTAVATLDRNLAGTTTATPAIRELTVEELDWVAGADRGDAAAGGGIAVGLGLGAVSSRAGAAIGEEIGGTIGAAIGGPVGFVVGFVGGAAVGAVVGAAIYDTFAN